ncbi:hypothetical protein [Bradyrhizobium sp.]|uniref:hypothetical protein n=1 Tax=Bradyrhizobium sp. TaxID=376 RepID=UPI003C703A0D
MAEIIIPDQAAALTAAIGNGWIKQTRIEDSVSLALFAELSAIMGRGEAASLALAAAGDFDIACDEKRVFRREAVKRLGTDRILTTPGLFVLAIRAGTITVEQADSAKVLLASKRFEMTFDSFKDVL